MPLAVSCSCGTVFQVGEALAGRKIRCKTCQTILDVPAATPTRTAPVLKAVPIRPQPAAPSRPTEPETADASYDMQFLPRARTVQESPTERESAEPPPKKSKKKSKRRYGDHADAAYDRRSDAERLDDAYGRMGESLARGGSGWTGDARAVVGGLLAMLLAVVWFFVGLHFGWIYFYPPILFILGLGAVIKGLTGGRD